MSTTTLLSPLPVHECAMRLEAAIDRDDLSTLYGLLGWQRVMGTVRDGTFRLRLRNWQTGESVTELRGVLLPEERQTRIEVRTALRSYLYWVLPLLACYLGLGTLWRKQHGVLPAMLVVGGAAVVVYLRFRLGRWLSRSDGDERVDFVTQVVSVRFVVPAPREVVEPVEAVPPRDSGRWAAPRPDVPLSTVPRSSGVAGDAPQDATVVCLVCREALKEAGARCHECGSQFHAACRPARCGMCGLQQDRPPAVQCRRAPR